jgi:hypothetical protein
MAPTGADRVSVLDIELDTDAERFRQLRQTPSVTILDTWTQQIAALAELRSAPDDALLDEPARWVYYPWRQTLVKLLGPRSYRALRLDRNRNLVTAQEQDRLGRLRIGIVGLSSGHAVAHTLAMSGFCGELRLTDFDELEVSNLNRVPATVFDLGVNKATVAMRKIAELDPYLPVRHFTAGLSTSNIAEFLAGLDIVVEQCDSLEIKLRLREHARALGIPVLMATSDRGLIDVERFDSEPTRPVLHGLMGDVSAGTVAGLSATQKLPYVLRVFDPERISTRMGASMLEVGQTLSAWPQLAGEIGLGAATVAEAVRRIGLGIPLSSGRAQLDTADVLDRIAEPGHGAQPEYPAATAPVLTTDVVDAATAAAVRAPSGGNSQPWHINSSTDQIMVSIDPQRTSTMDVGFRGSATAVGAAVFNARVAAAAHGRIAEVSYTEPGADRPLQAVMRLSAGDEPESARWYPAVLHRETNRNLGSAAALPPDVAATLTELAQQHGARLHTAVDRHDIASIARLFGAADRIRYLDPRLHREMFSELRWPGDADMDFGIDIRSLELDQVSLAALALLRRPDVMASIDDWHAGTVLGEDTARRILSSSIVATVLVTGATLCDFARGGAAVAAVWTAAQTSGLAVQPVSPPFLYAHNSTELGELSGKHAAELGRLRDEFGALIGKQHDESMVLTLRMSTAPEASVSSRRSVGIANTKG